MEASITCNMALEARVAQVGPASVTLKGSLTWEQKPNNSLGQKAKVRASLIIASSGSHCVIDQDEVPAMLSALAFFREPFRGWKSPSTGSVEVKFTTKGGLNLYAQGPNNSGNELANTVRICFPDGRDVFVATYQWLDLFGMAVQEYWSSVCEQAVKVCAPDA
jgi:hypothetical protein